MASSGGRAQQPGGGGGKKTARSQAYARAQNDSLRQYGYPSSRELRREAQGLAGASVPSVGQVSRPYDQQIQSSRDYLAAVRAALAETQGQVGAGYDSALAQSQGVDQAAQARLAGLGLGADTAGVQAATGASGDSAAQNLIANAAAANNYAGQLPSVASGQASQFADVTRNKLLDALANRRDSLSQAFFQALQQVQSNALARAQFNQSSDQFAQQMAFNQQQLATSAGQAAASLAERRREFNASQKAAAAKAVGAGYTPNEVQGFRADIQDLINTAKKGTSALNKSGKPRVNATFRTNPGGSAQPGEPPAVRGLHWTVPPAPNGAPNEPNQPNSIFYLYNFLSQRYDPSLQPLILAELQAAYPQATWDSFSRAMQGQSGPSLQQYQAHKGG